MQKNADEMSESENEAEIKVRLIDDLPVQKDAFGGHQRVANAVVDLITKEKGGKAVALEGGWGSGKSSVVKMVENGLKDSNDQVFVFDAWSHQGDPLRRAFLEKLSDVCVDSSDFKKKEYWDTRMKREVTGRIRTVEQTVTPILSSKWAILSVALLLLYPLAWIALRTLWPGAESAWELGLVALFGLIAIIPVLIAGGLFFYCWSDTKAKREVAGKFIALWAKQIDENVQTTAHEAEGPSSIEFVEFFEDLVKDFTLETEKSLVIVLDNLDRIPVDEARDLWSTLRIFAECCERSKCDWSKKVWFVVPYDPGAVHKLWDGQSSQNGNRNGSDENSSVRIDTTTSAFLDKTFQIRFWVPPIHVADWEKFVKEELLSSALPEFGTTNEHHKVYRLTEHLTDEKGRPPSPRLLKLYANDIGGMMRQFRDAFPLDHYALYALLKRNGIDVRKWVEDGSYKNDSRASGFQEDEYLLSLLAMHFGTTNTERAKTVLLEEPIWSALTNGNGETLGKLAKNVPGFWPVFQRNVENGIREDDLNPSTLVNVANAIEESDMSTQAPDGYDELIPGFSRKVVRQAQGIEINEETGTAFSIFIKQAKEEETTRRVFKGVLATYNSSEEDSDEKLTDRAEEWVSGVTALLEVLKDLDHSCEIHVGSEARAVVSRLAALHRTKLDADFKERIRFTCPEGSLGSTLSAKPNEEWLEENWEALQLLEDIEDVSLNRETLVQGLSGRLNSNAPEKEETLRILNALLLIYPYAGNEVSEIFSNFVGSQIYFRDLNENVTSPEQAALLLSVSLLGKKVKPTGNQQQQNAQNFNKLQALLQEPDQHEEHVSSFIKFVFEYPNLPIVEQLIAMRGVLGVFAKKVFEYLAKEESLGNVFPADVFLEQFDGVRELAGDGLKGFTETLLTSESFQGQCGKLEIEEGHEKAHTVLVEAGALEKIEVYRKHLLEWLGMVVKEKWVEELWTQSALWWLLIAVINRNEVFSCPHNLCEAVEEYANSLLEEKNINRWKKPPEDWDVFYARFHQSGLNTRINRILDGMKSKTVKDLGPLIELFSDDLAVAFAGREEETFVRNYADPIIKNGDADQLKWLKTAMDASVAFWAAANDDNKDTLSTSLKHRIGNEAEGSEERNILIEIANRLRIQYKDEAEEGGEQ